MVLASDLRVCYFVISKYFSVHLRFRMECKRALGKQKIGERKYFYGLKREHPKAAWQWTFTTLPLELGFIDNRDAA